MLAVQRKQLNLTGEGVLVLGIERAKGVFLGAPSGDTSIGSGDTVLLYGRSETIENLDRRRKGLPGGLARQDRVRAHQKIQVGRTGAGQPGRESGSLG